MSEALIPRYRTSMCIHCRTAVFAGETCDVDPDHEVISLFDPVGREALIEAAWGPADRRVGQWRRMVRSEESVVLAGILGMVAGVWMLWYLVPGFTVVHILGAILSGVLFTWAGRRMLAPATPDFPAGAPPLALSPSEKLGVRGEIDGDLDLTAPASGTDCIGYAVELRLAGNFGEKVMYRDAASAGFDVYLDGGGVARVPPGRLRLAGPLYQEIDVDNLELEDYLSEVDPHHNPDHAFDPLRFNVVYEQVLLPGDRVELISVFEPTINPDADPTLYRESAPTYLAPRGVPVMRLLRPRQ